MYTKAMPLERKLCQDIIVNYPRALEDPDLFGIEVELEGKKVKTNKPPILEHWAMHPDNSLRVHLPDAEAIEYVLRQPYNYKSTYHAMKLLFDHLNSPGVEVFPSYRTSIHVHLSCVADTYRTIFNFMTLAVIFDELLVSQNGKHRIGNNFCLRSRDAEGQIEDVIKSIELNGTFCNLNGHNRYSAINFVSLLKYGTIEFRSLECTTDFDRLVHWVNTLHRLRTMARTYKDPQEIIQSFSLMSGPEFITHVLGEYAFKYMKVDGWEALLQQGMRLAQDLAYCSKWVAQDPKSKPKTDEYDPWTPKPKGKVKKNPFANWNPGEPIPNMQNLPAGAAGMQVDNPQWFNQVVFAEQQPPVQAVEVNLDPIEDEWG